MDKKNTFEQGPIRPPSEAQSLLLRFTRNCSWNKCLFCPVYKHQTFSRRSVAEVKADIDTVAEIVAEVKAVSQKLGFAGRIDQLGMATRRVELGPAALAEAPAPGWLFTAPYVAGRIFL